MNKTNRKFIVLIAIALLLKIALFSYVACSARQSMFAPDSEGYIKTGITLITEGKFATENTKGIFIYQLYRTPGYPLFLGILNVFFRIPLIGIVFVQMVLTVIAGYFTYKAALLIDEELAPLSALIVLFDPPATVFSMMLLTEALFLFLISLFMYLFLSFLRTEKIVSLVLSALVIVAAVYVRPVVYFIPVAMAIFLVFVFMRKSPKKAFFNALVFALIVYGMIAPWHLRNIKRFNMNKFCSINNATISEQWGTGLYRSYKRNKDPISKGLPPVAYYSNVTARCLFSLFTRPANFKYFGNRAITVVGKVFSYPWIFFWMLGLLVGLSKMKGNTALYFLAFIILYFTTTTVFATMWGSGPRFRVPMVPFMAILSAYGWQNIKRRFCK
ncbi:MAG: glycosyltransferase family 39 protein [Candidatus Omnitrophica bacterium]|nr:glycosyltransferase family 39 protein [Candidatus Omnitrophota bacterium]MBU1996216.1 glycosyltransferase family 39 protein [Candidatus Omnitrophota bacterium]MBU4333602.1 glycosyltransferase family 39 protein [Candidatus Omnitrophota bacterium]